METTMSVNNKEQLSMFEQMEASDAYSIMVSIIDAKIRYYNKMYIRNWEKDHSTTPEYFNTKISELEDEKTRMMSFIRDLTASSQAVSFNANIELQAIS